MKIKDELVLKDIYAAAVGYYQMREYGECLKKLECGLRWPDLDNEDLHDFYFYKACCEDEMGFYREAYDTIRAASKLIPGCQDCDEVYKEVLQHMGKEVERLFTQRTDLDQANEMLTLLGRDENFSEEFPQLTRRLARLKGGASPLAAEPARAPKDWDA